jgi:hypothetical protein
MKQFQILKYPSTYCRGFFTVITGFTGETDPVRLLFVFVSPARGLKSAKSPFALAELKSAKSSSLLAVGDFGSARRAVV